MAEGYAPPSSTTSSTVISTVSSTVNSKGPERYTFFWKAESPFSQWHPSKFTVDGILYGCAEQYMMYQKAILFGDDATAQQILKTDVPWKQKYLGRRVKNFDEAIWMGQCRDVVKQGNMAKFSQSEKLKKMLLETRGSVLVEASPVEWGIGYVASHPKAQTRATYPNWLGFALTEVRDELMP